MTITKLNSILKEYAVPDDTFILSDSGWECSATDTDGIWYSAYDKKLILTQEFSPYCPYFENERYVLLYGINVYDGKDTEIIYVISTKQNIPIKNVLYYHIKEEKAIEYILSQRKTFPEDNYYLFKVNVKTNETEIIDVK